MESRRKCKIRYGRVFVLLLIAAWLTAIIWFSLTEDKYTWKHWRSEQDIFKITSITLSCFMMATLLLLSCKLKTQARLLTSSASFGKETCYLVTTVLLLSVSYLVPLSYHFVPENRVIEDSYENNMLD